MAFAVITCSIGNHMNVMATIKIYTTSDIWKIILLKFHEPLGEGHLKEFSNITSSVNLLEISYYGLFITVYMSQKIAKKVN